MVIGHGRAKAQVVLVMLVRAAKSNNVDEAQCNFGRKKCSVCKHKYKQNYEHC
jgi:hypothetical protein